MSAIRFELASAADDEELRRMLRENAMPGSISVTFEREPSYFIGAQVEGPFHQTIIARDQPGGRLVGMGSRSIRERYVNGMPQPVGYLSQVRIAPDYRSRRTAWKRAFEFLKALHQDGRAPFYFTSIIADNKAAHRLFSAGLPWMPRLHKFGVMHTLAIHCRRRRPGLPMPSGMRMARGSLEYLGAITECLQRNGARFQLAPHWSEDTLCSPGHTPGLTPADFLLALRGERVVGCLAAWDQSGFKQTVVRGYSGTLGRWRPLANLASRLLGWAALPPVGKPFRYCFASHLAVDEDRPDVVSPLVRALYNDAVGRKYDYFMLGLGAGHPSLEPVTASYPHIDYRSQLYLVTWERDLDVPAQVEDRLPAVEISLL